MIQFLKRQHPPHHPIGLDYQGRHPEAAEPCTDMGVEESDLQCAGGIVRALIWSLAIWFVGIVSAVAVLWPAGAP